MSGRVFGDPFAVVPESILYAPISANAVRLYAIFQRHANQEGCAYPGLKRLAELMGVSEDTVRRAKKELVDTQLITVEPAYRDDGSQTTDNVFLPPPGRTRATPPGRKGATPRTRASMTDEVAKATSVKPPRKNGVDNHQPEPPNYPEWKPDRHDGETVDLSEAVATVKAQMRGDE